MATFPYFRYFLISVILVLLQTTIIRFLSIGGITPDLLVIWIAYVALKHGQIPGTVAGFGIGLVIDLISGDFLGLSAVSKTLSGFIAGYFYNENKTEQTLRSYRLVIIVLVISLIHNIIYFMIFLQGAEIGFWPNVLKFGLTTSLYTAVISLLPMLAFSRVQVQ